MAQPTGPSCPLSSIAPSRMRTIGRKSPTSPNANASDKCDDSSPLDRRNDSYQSMESFRISSAWDDICCEQLIIGSYETALSSLGTRRRVPTNGSKGSQLAGIGWLDRRQLDSTLMVDFSGFDVYNVGIDVGIVDNKERP